TPRLDAVRAAAFPSPRGGTALTMKGQPAMNVSRRYILKSAFAASAGLVLAACGGGSASTPAGSSPAAGSAAGSGAASRTAAASPAGSPSASGGAASAVAGTWDDLLAAAKKEGKVVVSGPPDPDSRAKLPPAFKARFGIDVEYLGGNSSQLAARIESERAANQYSMDVSISGSDSMMETFYKNKWIEPWKSSVLLPETADASKWRSGGPWFRDPNQDTILQVFNTVQPMITINLANVSPKDLPNADALLDPRWKGKIRAYDPSVNGAGLAIGCAAYVAKGQDYVTKLYKGQNVTLSRDYQQVADWVAQGSYPIALATQLNYLDKYIKAGVKIAQSGSTDLAEFPDAGSAL